MFQPRRTIMDSDDDNDISSDQKPLYRKNSPNQLSCNVDGCQFICYSKSSLKRHRKGAHPNVVAKRGRPIDENSKRQSKKFKRSQEGCNDSFVSSSDVNGHRSAEPSIVEKRNNLECGICDMTFVKWMEFIKHLNDSHDQQVRVTEEAVYDNMETFKCWLTEVELKTQSKFVKNDSSKTGKMDEAMTVKSVIIGNRGR